MEAVQGRGVYNSLKELNVIDELAWLEFWQQVNNKLDDKVLEVELDVVGLEKALSHLELERDMSITKKRKEVDQKIKGTIDK